MPVKFDRQHYNALAKLFRINIGNLSSAYNSDRCDKWDDGYHALQDFAVECAKYFQLGDPRFDPIRFLDACTPEEDNNNLSELWEG
jgi:hypothetical protein